MINLTKIQPISQPDVSPDLSTPDSRRPGCGFPVEMLFPHPFNQE